MAGIWSRFFGSSVSTATGYGMGSALGPALRPVTQEVANEAWARYPNRPLSPETVAEAEIRDALGQIDALAESLKSGTNEERLDVLRLLAGQPPAPEQLLELWNRGVVSEARVDHGLRQSRLRPEWYDAYKTLRTVLVPVSDLVRMAVREVFSPDSRAALDLDAEYPDALTGKARDLGLSEQSARDYWAAHWQLPSREEGAAMWFRGELTEAQYDGLLRALDYSPTWRGPLKAITKAIPTLSDMVRFAVREVYDPAARKRLDLDGDYPAAFTTQAAKHGLAETDARDYWAAHWRLPSPQQMYRMLWRGEITQDELDAGLKAADYAPVWRGRLSRIAYLVPGRVDLRRMLAAKIIDRDEVKRGYQRLGYTPQDAETLTRFAEQQAASGSTTQEKWADRARSRLFTVTHNEYLEGTLDRAGAEAALAVVGVPASELPDVFAAWEKENEIDRQTLTVAQVRKAFKSGAWTREEAVASLTGRGIRLDDVETLLET